jgi:hypothetical protein
LTVLHMLVPLSLSVTAWSSNGTRPSRDMLSLIRNEFTVRLHRRKVAGSH